MIYVVRIRRLSVDCVVYVDFFKRVFYAKLLLFFFSSVNIMHKRRVDTMNDSVYNNYVFKWQNL